MICLHCHSLHRAGELVRLLDMVERDRVVIFAEPSRPVAAELVLTARPDPDVSALIRTLSAAEADTFSRSRLHLAAVLSRHRPRVPDLRSQWLPRPRFVARRPRRFRAALRTRPQRAYAQRVRRIRTARWLDRRQNAWSPS